MMMMDYGRKYGEQVMMSVEDCKGLSLRLRCFCDNAKSPMDDGMLVIGVSSPPLNPSIHPNNLSPVHKSPMHATWNTIPPLPHVFDLLQCRSCLSMAIPEAYMQ